MNTLIRGLLPILMLSLVGWSDSPSTTLNSTNSTNAKPGKTYYYDFDATTDSGELFIGQCSSISWYLAPDADGATTGAQVNVMEVPSPSGSAGAPTTFDCDAAPNTILPLDRDGDGIVDATVQTGALGFRGGRNVKPATPHICIDVVAASGHSRVVLTCNP